MRPSIFAHHWDSPTQRLNLVRSNGFLANFDSFVGTYYRQLTEAWGANQTKEYQERGGRAQSMKATFQEYAFHQRILARDDPVAFASFAEWLYVPLVQDVSKRAGSRADAMLVEEAVGGALLDYHDHPDRYDPGRAGLRSYLCMAAYRDFQNAQAKEQRLQCHQQSLSDAAHPAWEIGEIQEMVDGQAQAEEIWNFIAHIFPDPTEHSIVTLIINDVHASEPYAQLLGLCDLPHDECVRQVQRIKYRITKRLRRNIAKQYDRRGET